jgi:methionyl-tRNA formyltransferase
MTIQVLVDNPSSWILPYAQQLVFEFKSQGHDCELITEHEAILPGDVLFLLGCEKILKPEKLALHPYNLVIHESALPQGKGWSPLTWQILEGKNSIPVTLFEASDQVDSGVIYDQMYIQFEGHELINELRKKQGEATLTLAKQFVKNYSKLSPRFQQGAESFYPRRRPADSRLDPNQTIAAQFNLLRVVDNDKYPAFFEYMGHKYIVKIIKAEPGVP